jgi:hypothetical protein
VRGIAYATITLAATVIGGQLPGLGTLVGAVPAPVRHVLIPFAAAALLTRLRIDGRSAHRFLLASLRHRLSHGWLTAFSPAPPIGSSRVVATDCVLVHDSSKRTGQRTARSRPVGALLQRRAA